MSDLSIRKCEACGSPIRLNEPCDNCGKGPPGHTVGAKKASGHFPKYFPGRRSSKTHIGEKFTHRQRVRRAQRVGLIMVLLALAIICVKHQSSPVRINLSELPGKVTTMFEMRSSGSGKGVLGYATIALSIDAVVLLILYLYSFARPRPGLMLLVVASIVDCTLLFDPVILVNPKAILAILFIKIIVIVLLLSGYKSAKVMEGL